MAKDAEDTIIQDEASQTEAVNEESPIEGEVEVEAVEAASEGTVNKDEFEALRQQLLRVHADFDNFRRRTRQEKEDLQRFATKKLLGELLPLADNFERAMQSLEQSDGANELKAGLDMVFRQMMQILQQNGVEVMDPVGQSFDPNVHDAVMQEPADGQEAGIVTQVLQKGYLLHGKVLRPAMVKVTV